MNFFVSGDATVKKKPAPKTPPKAGNWSQQHMRARESSAVRGLPFALLDCPLGMWSHPAPRFKLCIIQAEISPRVSVHLGPPPSSTTCLFSCFSGMDSITRYWWLSHPCCEILLTSLSSSLPLTEIIHFVLFSCSALYVPVIGSPVCFPWKDIWGCEPYWACQPGWPGG